MAAPFVSLLLVTHNGGAWLREALASALNQTGVDHEVVVLDNNSTDGAMEAVEREFPDPRVRVVRSGENLHQAGGLNAAFAASRGDYIALMDHDDVLEPQRLRRQLEHLVAHPDLDGVATYEDELHAHGVRGPALFCVVDPDQMRAYARYDMPFTMHSLMLSRRILERVRWRREFAWATDLDFVQRLTEVGRIEILPEVLYHYRVHAGAVSFQRAAALRHMAAFGRLVGARRRAGRPEELEALAPELAVAKAGARPEPEMLAQFAERFLDEGFRDLALMYARRIWAMGKRRLGLSIAFRALASAPRNEWNLLWRMAWLGPAHALRIRSHPPLAPRGWNLFKSGRREMHARVQP